MRILMTSDCVGGVWSYATTLCRGLGNLGVDVTLAVSGGAMSDAQRAEAASLSNVDLRHEPFKCEWMQPPLADVEAAGAWLEALVAETRPDVVHLNDYAHGGRDFGGRPRVVVAHSDVVSWHHAVLGEPPGDAWHAYEGAIAAGLAEADTVVAPTRAVLDGMGIDGIVIPNAVEPSRVEPAAEREPFILTAGRLWDDAKNGRLLAEAATRLPWPVKVAGDATHPDGGTIGLPNVDLLGPLPRGELRRLMARASIYALPAKYEPFGLSAVEAALGGCALVLGDIPSLREVWGDAAVFVPTDDAGVLRDALLRLIDDPAERARLARAAGRRARRYIVRRQAAAYRRLYCSLCRR